MALPQTRSLPSPDRNQFVEEMIPYVKYLAHRMAVGLPACVDIDDLVHYGVLGLLDAYEKFDVDKGVKFKTYAETRIRGAMLDGMRAADWVPRSVRKKRRALEEAYRKVEQQEMRPASNEEVAEVMGLSLEDFLQLLSSVAGLSLGSIEELLPDGEDRGLLLRYGADPDDEHGPQTLVEHSELRRILAQVIGELPEKERVVLSLYYYEELTMKEIGRVLGISESRISQLHTKAILRIRGQLQAMLTH